MAAYFEGVKTSEVVSDQERLRKAGVTIGQFLRQDIDISSFRAATLSGQGVITDSDWEVRSMIAGEPFAKRLLLVYVDGYKIIIDWEKGETGAKDTFNLTEGVAMPKLRLESRQGDANANLFEIYLDQADMRRPEVLFHSAPIVNLDRGLPEGFISSWEDLAQRVEHLLEENL